MKSLLYFLIIIFSLISPCLHGQFQRMAIPKGTFSLAKNSRTALPAFCLDLYRSSPETGVSYTNILNGASSAFLTIIDGTKQTKIPLKEAIEKKLVEIEGISERDVLYNDNVGDFSKLSFKNNTGKNAKIEIVNHMALGTSDETESIPEIDKIGLPSASQLASKPNNTANHINTAKHKPEARHAIPSTHDNTAMIHTEFQEKLWMNRENDPSVAKDRDKKVLSDIKKYYDQIFTSYFPNDSKHPVNKASIFDGFFPGESVKTFKETYGIKDIKSPLTRGTSLVEYTTYPVADVIAKSVRTKAENLNAQGNYYVLNLSQSENSYLLLDGSEKPLYKGDNTVELISTIKSKLKSNSKTTYLNVDRYSFSDTKREGLKASLNLQHVKINNFSSTEESDLFFRPVKNLKQIEGITEKDGLHTLEYEVDLGDKFKDYKVIIKSKSKSLLDRIIEFLRKFFKEHTGDESTVDVLSLAKHDLGVIFKNDPNFSDVEILITNQLYDKNYFVEVQNSKNNIHEAD